MRILFLCSCLEPGRDGVGDYVRLLADACARQGHHSAMVALNDPFVVGPPEEVAEGETAVARLPASMAWEERIERVKEFRERFQPNWISFQLVPYAFQKRGILSKLIPIFQALTEGAPLHLMFHELWLGAGRPLPLRFYVVGRWQSLAIRKLVARLQPEVITASNPVYVAMLRNLPVEAKVLPLFGNVPILNENELPSVEELLPTAGINAKNREAWWIGLFFGALHEQWKPEPFLGILQRAAARAGKRICLVLVGRSGRTIWDALQRDYGKRIVFIHLGEQPPSTISSLLQRADFGVASSPWQLIGKSGTAAAMLDHGLPVIVTRDDFQPFVRPDQPPSSDPLLHRCDDRLEDKLAAGLPKRPARARVDEIAAELCGELAHFHAATP